MTDINNQNIQNTENLAPEVETQETPELEEMLEEIKQKDEEESAHSDFLRSRTLPIKSRRKRKSQKTLKLPIYILSQILIFCKGKQSKKFRMQTVMQSLL